MTDAYSLKQAFSCSDFLNELWQNGADSGDSLVGLPAPSEGGSAQLAREKSADMLDLLGGPEETQSNTNAFGAIASSSSNQQGLPGGFSLTADNVDSSFRSQLSATQPIMHDPFIAQPALPDFHQGFHAQASRSGLPPVQTPTLLQAEFQMDPAKQAQALCHNGLSITALQQQLQDLKGKSSLDASCLRGSQAGPDTFLQDAGSARHVSTNLQGGISSASTDFPTFSQPPLSHPLTAASTQQPQLGLQQHQLRQLAQLLGSANVSALQSLAAPTPSGLPDMAGTSQRIHSSHLHECATSSGLAHDHSSGDDDTGALGDLHKLAGLGEDGEESWEAKLDKSLPPPEMKRMRRMLSNRESARRSRRRKQAHMQDLEVQNLELMEVNEKLLKEVGALRSLAKEALLDKKKSQAALEAFKHQVVHVLGEHDIMFKQDPAAQEQAQQAPAVAADSADSESLQLALKAGDSSSTTPPDALLTRAQQQNDSPKGMSKLCGASFKASPPAPKSAQSPMKGSLKRKAVSKEASALGLDGTHTNASDKVRKL